MEGSKVNDWFFLLLVMIIPTLSACAEQTLTLQSIW